MMIKTLKSSEISIIDENSSYLGVDRKLLMENAGAEVARFIIQNEGDLSSKSVIVFAGPGNNGGDAFVAARHLAARARKIIVALIGDEDKIKTLEARTNWQIIKNMKISIEFVIIREAKDLQKLSSRLSRSDIIVDGIFGTGIRGDIREPYRSVIEWINKSGAIVYSIDVPSGIDPDSGAGTLFVRPSFTITLHSRKPFIDIRRPEEIGEIIIRPIGAPVESEYLAGPGDMTEVLKLSPSINEVSLVGGSQIFRKAIKDIATKLNISVVEQGTEDSQYELIANKVLITNNREKLSKEKLSVYAYYVGEKENQVNLEYANLLKKLSSSIGYPMYECGGPDYITDGERLKTNWIEPPIPCEYYFGAVALFSAIFLQSKIDVIYSLAGASFIVRKSISELKSPTEFDEFVNKVASMLKISL
ncbi:MAG: NAD(P)H-hydrate epimerase [Nitrososphaerota archaeon]